MDINIRFTITQKDGKLEKMMNKVPSSIRTEVVKEALRFYLRAVRDREIESDFLDAELLSSFQSNISKKIDIEDMKQLLGAKAVATATVNTTEIVERTNDKKDNIKNEDIDNYEENNDDEYLENEDEEDTTSDTFINIDIDEDDF